MNSREKSLKEVKEKELYKLFKEKYNIDKDDAISFETIVDDKEIMRIIAELSLLNSLNNNKSIKLLDNIKPNRRVVTKEEVEKFVKENKYE